MKVLVVHCPCHAKENKKAKDYITEIITGMSNNIQITYNDSYEINGDIDDIDIIIVVVCGNKTIHRLERFKNAGGIIVNLYGICLKLNNYDQDRWITDILQALKTVRRLENKYTTTV